jgi:ABC-type branched-subunit amino acid transport system substrate-binding protein
MRSRNRLLTACALAASLASLASLAGCGKKVEDKNKDPGQSGAPGAGTGTAPAQGAAPGVDPARKVISLGALNDESGPAKQLGVSIANGKRLLVKAVKAGAVKLPDGWTIELVERDHGYNPQQSVQLYKEIRDQILFLSTSFGTQMTLPLREDLRRDDVLAFPAALSSVMAQSEHTPPLGASYRVEAMRAMDWAVEVAGGADKVKAGIVHQRDDYGQDGLDGWKAAAAHHKVPIVAAQTVKTGDQDFTTVVKALKDAGATHVLLTALPSHTPGILGAAAKLSYAPIWIGNTPAWTDVFFAKLSAGLFERFHWVTGLTYWGEDVHGMKDFLEVWKAHGAGMGEPDYVILVSYIQGLAQVEALRRAIEANELHRAGVRKALHSIKGWDVGGLSQPVDLSKVPYETSDRTRILKPDFEKKSWTTVADWAAPKALP